MRVAPPAPPGSVWRNVDFVKLWTASTISAFGDFFSAFALPLLVFVSTGSAVCPAPGLVEARN